MRKIYRNKATLLSSLHIVYSRHHELVDRCEISISQMTMDLFTFNVYVFLSSITDKIQEVLTLRGLLVGFRFFLCPFRVAHHFSFLWFFFYFICHRSVSCSQCCRCLYIANSWIPLRVTLTFIYHNAAISGLHRFTEFFEIENKHRSRFLYLLNKIMLTIIHIASLMKMSLNRQNLIKI